MFRLIEQLNLDNQCICKGDDDDNEMSDKNMKRAAAAISSINGVPQDRSYETLCVWMMLFVGMNRYVQQKDF